MKEKFNPKDWLNQAPNIKETTQNAPEQRTSNTSCSNDEHGDTTDNTELIIGRIEQAMADLTSNYSDWLSLGFAFANEYGEAGRNYYHRISRFYTGYSATGCDKQYDQCLKAKGHGITIKTFFHLAKQAGIDVRTSSPCSNNQEPPELPPWPDYAVDELQGEAEPVNLPHLPESVFAQLPEFLARAISMAETKEERDVLLLGAITVLGSCMPKLYGIYDGNKVHPNLYLFITSQASAGKGRLNCCKSLVKPVHYALRKQFANDKQAYEAKMREYSIDRLKDQSIEKPEKPPERMLLIPANCSATGMFQLLHDNEGQGLIFETEGDTLSMTFKSDHGNYSDGFRKAFHHESISYYRRTDHEFVEIDMPRLSTVLGGTNKQVATLIPNAENGLFSRFIFYYMNIKPVWKNVFAPNKDNGIDEHFNKLGYEFFKLYEALSESDAIQFCFTRQQKEEFHQFFSQVQEKYLTLQGMDYMATIRRLGLIAFRIAMVFNTLRILETGDFSQKQECSDADFYSSLAIIKVLIKHSSHVFTQLQEEVKVNKKANKKEMFLEKLPEKFTHGEYVKIAKELGVQERSADIYMASFCKSKLVKKEQRDGYINLSLL